MRKVVVTGIGIYSCIGSNVAEVRDSLHAGRSGIGLDPRRTEYGYRSPLTGIVESPDLKKKLDRRSRTMLSEEGEYAYVATAQAFADAAIDADYLAANEVGIFYGNDSSAKAVIDTHMTMLDRRDSMMLGFGSVFRSMNSTVSMTLSTIFRLRGANMTVSAACASGSHAIGLGTMFIRQGLQDVVLVGGAQETNYMSMSSFDGLSAFSMRTGEPARASRPFDADRDGLVPSGGAASLVLEDYDHAVARGAKIYAEVAGYGFSSNGAHISQPSGTGSSIAMMRALAESGLEPGMIDYVNAHATSTPIGDAEEAAAIGNIFGEFGTPVSSTKSMTGHECWMAGASEAVYSLIMMRDSFIAPNINFERPDEYSAGINIVTRTVDRRLDAILSNSFGFGGTNSALVFRKVK